MVAVRRRRWKIWLVAPICLLLTYVIGFYCYAKPQGATGFKIFPPGMEWHGRQIVYELDTDGIELWMRGSAYYGRWDFPALPKLIDKPKIDADEKGLQIEYGGKREAFSKPGCLVTSWQWLPERKTLAMIVDVDEEKHELSEVWVWSSDHGFRRLYTYPGSLVTIRSSLDGNYVWAVDFDPEQCVAFALDGSKQWKPTLSSEFMMFNVVMLSDHEFLGAVNIVNEGEFLQKWSTVTKRLEKLTVPTGLTSAMVFDGKLWAHRHDGIARFGMEPERVNDVICLAPDLKTIEQVIPLPKDLEHFESR